MTLDAKLIPVVGITLAFVVLLAMFAHDAYHAARSDD